MNCKYQINEVCLLRSDDLELRLCADMNCDFKKLARIEEYARTLGNDSDIKHRLSDESISKLLRVPNDLLSTEDILRKNILKVLREE